MASLRIMRKAGLSALLRAAICTAMPLCLLLLTASCGKKKVDVGINNSAIELIDSVHDFGLCRGDSIVKQCSFRLRNSGTEPLIINKIETSCGCTVADFQKTPVEQGETTTIKVTYKDAGHKSGSFMKTLTIYSNARNGLAQLVICGRTE